MNQPAAVTSAVKIKQVRQHLAAYPHSVRDLFRASGHAISSIELVHRLGTERSVYDEENRKILLARKVEGARKTFAVLTQTEAHVLQAFDHAMGHVIDIELGRRTGLDRLSSSQAFVQTYIDDIDGLHGHNIRHFGLKPMPRPFAAWSDAQRSLVNRTFTQRKSEADGARELFATLCAHAVADDGGRSQLSEATHYPSAVA